MAVDALAGVVWSSPLVRDEIVAPLTVAPQIAPSVSLGASLPLDARDRLGIRFGWARSDLVRTEQDETTAILPLTVWSGSVVLERLLSRQVAGEARLGGLKYAPGGDANGTIFQDDAPFAPLLGLGVRAWQPIGGRVVIGLQLAYDFHRFETQALKSGGFTSARSVHRLAVNATLRWSTRRATP
jgi:hypothetical protein